MENVLKKMDLAFFGQGKHKISLEKLLKTENALFLDVRSKEEVEILKFDLSPLGIKTLHIPLEELPEKLDLLPSDGSLIACFCSSGVRSSWASLYLFSKGYNARLLQANNEDLALYLKPGNVYKLLKEK